MTPTEVAAEIVERIVASTAVQTAGLRSAHYPAPGTLPAVPTLILWWDEFEKTEGMGEQYWICRYKGQLFTSVDDLPDAIVAVDPLAVAIADVFDASTQQENFTLGYQTDGCEVTSGSLSKQIPYAGQLRYGGELYFQVQFRRFAGS